jgi:TIR domain
VSVTGTRAPQHATGDGPAYDGFISYSHAADDLLAPRLQAALQRFAKPWWRRRALRIFRDDASLTANPHLWASIAAALDDSDWFVLLLSPEASRSEWVNREVQYWLDHKDPARIIPVLTGGELGWSGGRLVSEAAPPALEHAFTAEPRWVDLRFARTDEQLDLNNASFRAAVADIAAPLRGRPKDELESEEVRQHRRTVRTAWAAGAALLILTLAAAGSAFYALVQRDEVAAQRDAARQHEEQAVAFAAQLLDYVRQRDITVVPDNPSFPDLGPVSYRYVDAPPNDARLDFLQPTCAAGKCVRDAYFVHPTLPLRTGPWNAYEPFHIRHGFVASGPVGDTAPEGKSVDVYLRRDAGPELEDDAFPLGRWFLYLPDYVVRETTDRCGPGYRDQTEPVACDVYVHDFPDGLPPGRYTFFVDWLAPCSDWFGATICDDPDEVVSLFDSQVESPFIFQNYREDEFPWPRDPWELSEPVP